MCVVKCLGDGGDNSAASAGENRFRPIVCRRSVPSINLETMKHKPSSVRPTSKTGTMCGWSRLARMRASVRYASASVTRCGSGTLMATRALQVFVVAEIDDAESPEPSNLSIR